jgi:hypothetical protein
MKPSSQPTLEKALHASPLPASTLNASSDALININEEASLTYWLAALGCSELQLRIAVAAVGPGASDVGIALGGAA